MRIRPRRCPDLVELSNVLSPCDLVNAYAAGLRAVPIDCRTGTEDRSSDFDACSEPQEPAVAERVEHMRHAFPGGDVPAIDAAAVLRSMEDDSEPLLGRRAAIYGGGNTAMGVARTAERAL
jgi:hypothetical protein